MAVAHKKVQVELLGRDRVASEFLIQDPGTPQAMVADLKLDASGCSLFIDRLAQFRTDLLSLSVSDRIHLLDSSAQPISATLKDFYRRLDGSDHVSILLRELILKLQNRFQLPYQEAELCHCRAVPTDVVDRAIVGGCHTTNSVARATSAGTSCGTCKPDTDSLISYRLKSL